MIFVSQWPTVPPEPHLVCRDVILVSHWPTIVAESHVLSRLGCDHRQPNDDPCLRSRRQLVGFGARQQCEPYQPQIRQFIKQNEDVAELST